MKAHSSVSAWTISLLASTLWWSSLGSGAALGQTVVTTVPVGFVKVTVAGAADATKPSLTALSVPFYGAVSYAGTISSVDSTSALSSSAAAWTSGQFVSAPTLLRIKSGASTGRFFLISANTSTQVSLTTGGYSLVTTTPTVGTQLQVAVGDKFEIVAANTLGSVFGAGSVALQTGASASVADNVLAYSPSTNGWITYFHDGASWRDAAVSGNQNNVVIAPDAALFVLRRATTAVDLYFSGTVPSTNEVADWAGSSGRFFGNRFPVDTTLGALGAHTSPNWKSGLSAGSSDNILVWNGSTWSCFYYNGTHWRRAGSLKDFDTQALPAGGGMFITRRGTSSVTGTLQLPYTF